MKWANVKVGMQIQNKVTGDVVTVLTSLADKGGFWVTDWADSDGDPRAAVYRQERNKGSGDGINNWRKVKEK